MLIIESHQDVPTSADGKGSMRNEPEAPPSGTSSKHSQAYTSSILRYPDSPRLNSLVLSSSARYTKVRLPPFSDPEIRLIDPYQVTGPVARFARQIAGHGYIVAAPSSYHEFASPEPLAYDGPGTDAGNDYKVRKVRCA